MPKNHNTPLPFCGHCGRKTTLKVTPAHHKGEMRDHYKLSCRKCDKHTGLWLMLNTCINHWVGA